MRIYLDVCCLNRPFDDQSRERIRLETEAVLSILNLCQIGEWELVKSEATELEISKIPDEEKRLKVNVLSSIAHSKIMINDEIIERATKISLLKFDAFDALHIACAEQSDADVMLTTDDSLIQKSLQNKNSLKIKVENPVKWLMEVI